MMDKLNELQDEYDKIDAMPEPQRTLHLSNLIDKIKATYNIPSTNDSNYNKQNKAVIQLYRKVLRARCF